LPNLVPEAILAVVIPFLFKLAGAVALWIAGGWLIQFSLRILRRGLNRSNLDATVLSYLLNILGAVLRVILVVAILGFFGIETASFAALLAGAGVAIGAAWSGMLGNFAAGAFLVVLRPFKVGDFVTIGGITGTVREIGLFATALDTPDNVRTVVGNGKVFGDTIQNFSNNPYRRVDLQLQLHHGVDGVGLARLLKDRIAKIPNVLADPAPDVEPAGATLAGPLFFVRPYCHTDHYWQVYFDTLRTVSQAFSEAGYPAPQQHLAVHQQA
jgi:small conductance mechanosensitive channel